MKSKTIRWPTRIVKIGPFRYRLKEDNQLLEAAGGTGATMPDSGLIFVATNLGPDAERETMVHECLHAIWNAALGLKFVEADKEEDAIRALAPYITMWLRDNPELIEWVQEET